MSSLVRDAHNPPRSPYWYCCYTSSDGQRLKKSTKTTDKRKAKIYCDAIEDAERQAKRGNDSDEQFRKILAETFSRTSGRRPYDPSVKQWFARWLDNVAPSVSRSTIARYQQIVTGFVRSLGPVANRRMEDVTPDHIQAYRDALVADGHAPKTTNLMFRTVLKRAFKIASEEGLVTRNVVATVVAVRGDGRAEKCVFRPEQIARLLEHADNDDWRGMVLFGFYTGARLMDLAGLRWENVDLAERQSPFSKRRCKPKARKRE